MMAVETNKDSISPASTLTGMLPANGRPRRKRPSALLQAASSLPSVETSLDEFIARANQTLADPSQWNVLEQEAKVQDEARREADSLRWKAAEHQLREGEAREAALRRQLDGLQGRLAEAEARAAVAGSGSQDGVIADLKMRLNRADERIHAAEDRASSLTEDLVAARAAAPAVSMSSSGFYNEGDSDERVRVAEAKAVKAIAVARAAAAGLTVNPADISAIESGLVVVSMDSPKGTNWLAVAGVFIGGLAIMFGAWKLLGTPADKAPAPVAAAAAAVAPAPVATPPAVAVKPVVTPIEEPAAAAPAEAPPTAVVEPAVTHHAATTASHKAAVQKAAAAPKAKATAASSGGEIADPFGDNAAKKPAKAAPKAEKKPAGELVDPF
jgi:hypothetical protein